ncbi:hypothetical protein AbraIFM66950_003232 [Aspergillus brasiliensis]|nr:hypothetical protein AbraIFM66950_003232 [Aspergillus brasiliensis]
MVVGHRQHDNTDASFDNDNDNDDENDDNNGRQPTELHRAAELRFIGSEISID